MTVVLEDQVKTITAEIDSQFGFATLVPGKPPMFCGNVDIEDVVRAVIAQYDIAGIARLEVPVDIELGGPFRVGDVVQGPPLVDEERARDDQNRNVI